MIVATDVAVHIDLLYENGKVLLRKLRNRQGEPEVQQRVSGNGLLGLRQGGMEG